MFEEYNFQKKKLEWDKFRAGRPIKFELKIGFVIVS
jgi:hypothetical protein